jgi:hypothetical protein
MPKYPERVKARKSVARRFRAFVNALLKQFATPPEELLRRAEAKLQAEARDRPAGPPAR